ncbi:hypothetical protein TWF696_007506 [Orbilia brochopaga]|uniref:N-acetyltransferase domain-containing protein n=1 Tax=Orbilia brochopaga TaxID=3140254 RepID=A0AAV9URJ3_9PEZI
MRHDRHCNMSQHISDEKIDGTGGDVGSASVPDIPLPAPFDDYYLCSLTPSDFSRLADLYNNTDLRYITFRPPYPYTQQDAQWFHDNMANAPVAGYPGTHQCWIIRSKSHDGILVGICSTQFRSGLDTDPLTLGYFVAPEFRGKGIMPTVINEVCRQFPGATFDAEVASGNASSCRVLEKCGFTKVEGFEHEMRWPESKGGDLRKMWKFVKLPQS